MGAYRNSPTLFRTVSSPTPYGILFPKIRGSQSPPKSSIAVIRGTGKATDFKFGQCIHRVHPNESPLNILEKRERGRIKELPKVFNYPLLSQERVKLRTSNFVRTFIGSIKISGKVRRGRASGLQKFLGHSYKGASRGHLCGSLAFLLFYVQIFRCLFFNV